MKTRILITAIALIGALLLGSANAQWIEQNSGTSNWLISVSAPTHNTAWVSGGSSTVLRTNDNGNHWQNVSVSAAADVWSIYALDKKTACATGFTSDWSSVAIFRTADGGRTWQIVLSLPASNYFLNAITFFDEKEGIVYGDPDYAFPSPNYWTIYKTYDGGLTWAPIANPPVQEGMNFGWKNAITCVGNTVFFGTTMFDENFNFGPDARIYRSTDRGLTWSYSVTPGVVQVNTIHFDNALTGFACRAKTTDGGFTWFTMNDPYATVPGDINNFILSATGTGNEVWVTGIHREGPAYFSDLWNNYTTVYYSADGGMNWVLDYTVTSGTPNEVRISRKATDTKSLFIIKDNGGIVFKKLEYDSPKIVSKNQDYKLMNNYPNPFNPVTNIRYQIPVNSFVSLKIYDITGREIATLVNEYKNAGTFDVQWNASGLSSGVYFYKLTSGNFTDIKRMTLIK